MGANASAAIPSSGSGPGTFQIEVNGINVVAKEEFKGKASDLFWPWFAANISVFGISYGAFLLGFSVSFWQSTIIGVIGIIISFLLCGIVAVASKRGHAPTMTLSRAAFGVNGNRLPSVLSWVLTVGWETVLVALAVLATATILTTLGWQGGDAAKVVALLIVAALIIFSGVLGFDTVMRVQQWITWIVGILTIVYAVLVFNQINWSTVSAIPDGTLPHVIGGFVFMLTGFGLGWVSMAGDYARYLPGKTSERGVAVWTTFGASVGPVILLIFGLLLAGSSSALSTAMASDPIGALAQKLPTWALIPFGVVAVLGLVGGAVLDIYSSGLALLNAGIKLPRYVAAGIDGTLMTLGAIYVVFIAADFLGPFQGFLITLGVPLAAWSGIFIGDLALRRRDYSVPDLFDPRGRYGNVDWTSVILLVVASVIGWGLVTNTYADWLSWQGFLLDPTGLGGKTGDWAYANLGVLAAFVICLVGTMALRFRKVRSQEALPIATPAGTLSAQPAEETTR